LKKETIPLGIAKKNISLTLPSKSHNDIAMQVLSAIFALGNAPSAVKSAVKVEKNYKIFGYVMFFPLLCHENLLINKY